MDYNNINKIGKVKDYNKEFGVGEIVSIDDIYLFTVNDIKEDLKIGDLVKFRGETVNDKNRAFFINKIDNNYLLKNNMVKSKKYNRE